MAKKHTSKEIQKSIKYAMENGWKLKEPGKSAHSWGVLHCSNNDSSCRCGEFCKMSIWSTPKSAVNHAKQIKKHVDKCIHNPKNKESNDE